MYEHARKTLRAAGWHMTLKENGLGLVELLWRLQAAARQAGVSSNLPDSKKDIAGMVDASLTEERRRQLLREQAGGPEPAAEDAAGWRRLGLLRMLLREWAGARDALAIAARLAPRDRGPPLPAAAHSRAPHRA
eukprot:gene9931-9683_t